MDLLQGYGSDDSSNTSVANDPSKSAAAAAATLPPSKPIHPPSTAPTAHASKKRGKRLLSLQSVLPPEILNRLTRPEGAESSEDEESLRIRPREVPAGNKGGDRSALNSLLDELRSAPRHQQTGSKQAGEKRSVSEGDTTKNRQENEGLGMAFMSYTTQTITKSNHTEVVDVHAKANSYDKEAHSNAQNTDDLEPTTAATKKATPIPFARMSAAAPIPNSMQHSLTAAALPSTYHSSTQPEIDATTPSATVAPFPPVDSNLVTTSGNDYNPLIKSRKQKRQEERALRTGTAFHQHDVSSSSTMDIHQPSPTEFAPTAHMAAIASRAAHLRGLGSIDPQDSSDYGEYTSQTKKSLGVAMYDPKTGTDVKGGVTAKHKSKHQINQLMVSAMGLEASRAGEAELARLGLGSGTGSGGGRADAKRKYGW